MNRDGRYHHAHQHIHHSQAPPEGPGSRVAATRHGCHFLPQLLSRDHSQGRFPPQSLRAGQELLRPWLWVTSQGQESPCLAQEYPGNAPPFHPVTPKRCLPAASRTLSSLPLRHGQEEPPRPE